MNFSGSELENTPENAFNGMVSYQRGMTEAIDWFVESDASFMDERFVDVNNALKLDSYWLANLRLGIVSENREVVGYVDNVFDDTTAKSGLSNIDTRLLAFDFGTNSVLVPNGARFLLPEPRTYGARLAYRFGN